MKNIYDFTLDELTKEFGKSGLPKFTAKQVFSWIYQKRVGDFSKMSNISKEARLSLEKSLFFPRLRTLKRKIASDGTVKFLFGLRDNSAIETVLIPKDERNTLCVSTQVGCKFRCSFCASGQKGFKRNLTASEILNQYLTVSYKIKPNKITNIVFMGIGEPLDNFNNVVKAIKILTDKCGIAFVKKRISISTCGLIPQINLLSDAALGVKLSISLHSADNNTRTQLMPINRMYPLTELIKAAKAFSRKEKYLVTFEYALLKGINTSREDALKLSRLLRGFRYKMNLIPLNSSDRKIIAANDRDIAAFTEALKKKKVFFTLRESRGQGIEAACGQLRASFIRGK